MWFSGFVFVFCVCVRGIWTLGHHQSNRLSRDCSGQFDNQLREHIEKKCPIHCMNRNKFCHQRFSVLALSICCWIFKTLCIESGGRQQNTECKCLLCWVGMEISSTDGMTGNSAMQIDCWIMKDTVKTNACDCIQWRNANKPSNVVSTIFFTYFVVVSEWRSFRVCEFWTINKVATMNTFNDVLKKSFVVSHKILIHAHFFWHWHQQISGSDWPFGLPSDRGKYKRLQSHIYI